MVLRTEIYASLRFLMMSIDGWHGWLYFPANDSSHLPRPESHWRKTSCDDDGQWLCCLDCFDCFDQSPTTKKKAYNSRQTHRKKTKQTTTNNKITMSDNVDFLGPAKSREDKVRNLLIKYVQHTPLSHPTVDTKKLKSFFPNKFHHNSKKSNQQKFIHFFFKW